MLGQHSAQRAGAVVAVHRGGYREPSFQIVLPVYQRPYLSFHAAF